MTAPPFLLIDLGNTTAKFRLATSSRLLGHTRRIATTDLTAATLQTLLAGWPPTRTVISSVVPAAARVVAASLANVVHVTPTLDTGVDLHGYPGAKTLGADRIANVAGALSLHGPGPLIVVDFGTAATFNVLDARGKFLGGIIAPGLAAIRDYLPAHTAQLPPVRLNGALPTAIGRNTVGALRAGAIIGYRGLVRELLTTLRTELAANRKGSVRGIATGGDAPWVAAQLPGLFETVDTDLTLQGLRVIAARL